MSATRQPQPQTNGFTSQLQLPTTNGNLLAFACGFLRVKTSVWMTKLNNFSIEHQNTVQSPDRVLFVPGSSVKKGDCRLTISCDCQTESSLDSHIVIVMIILLTSTPPAQQIISTILRHSAGFYQHSDPRNMYTMKKQRA